MTMPLAPPQHVGGRAGRRPDPGSCRGSRPWAGFRTSRRARTGAVDGLAGPGRNAAPGRPSRRGSPGRSCGRCRASWCWSWSCRTPTRCGRRTSPACRGSRWPLLAARVTASSRFIVPSALIAVVSGRTITSTGSSTVASRKAAGFHSQVACKVRGRPRHWCCASSPSLALIDFGHSMEQDGLIDVAVSRQRTGVAGGCRRCP